MIAIDVGHHIGCVVTRDGVLEPHHVQGLERLGQADGVSIGRLFIANPDLVRRISLGAPLNEGKRSTYYSGGPGGYIDYPTQEQAEAA